MLIKKSVIYLTHLHVNLNPDKWLLLKDNANQEEKDFWQKRCDPAEHKLNDPWQLISDEATHVANILDIDEKKIKDENLYQICKRLNKAYDFEMPESKWKQLRRGALQAERESKLLKKRLHTQ
jgi:hypothetical protein